MAEDKRGASMSHGQSRGKKELGGVLHTFKPPCRARTHSLLQGQYQEDGTKPFVINGPYDLVKMLIITLKISFEFSRRLSPSCVVVRNL